MAAAAAVPDGVSSCGSANMRRADHLPRLPIPLPCMGEPTAASRVSPGSSPARSEASRGAPCYNANAEPDPEPEAEATVGQSTQMLLAMAAMGGRGGPYGRRPASSYGSCAAWSAGSLTRHRPASPSPICSPVNSHGGGGGEEDREPHGGDDASSFVTPRMGVLDLLDKSGLHEVVLGTTGRKQGTSSKAAHLPSTESLLCKRRLLEAFMSLEHPLVGQLKCEELSYRALKDTAHEYHHTLELLRKAPFFGCWRAKPTFLDSFAVSR